MTHKKHIFLFLFLAFLFVTNANSQNDVEQKKKNAQALFQERDNKQKLEETIKLLEEVISLKADDYSSLIMLCRAYYCLGEITDDKEQKLSIHAKGLEYGEKSLKTVEGYTNKMAENETEALKAIPNEKLDAIYWSAANIAKWAKVAPFSKKVSSKARVRMFWDEVCARDSSYFYGGVYRFFGGYFALVPSITGEQDTDKSKAMFEKAVKVAPDYLDTKVIYAEAYCTHAKIRDRQLFEKLLNEVLLAEAGSNMDIAPENRLAKMKAKKLLDEANALFE